MCLGKDIGVFEQAKPLRQRCCCIEIFLCTASQICANEISQLDESLIHLHEIEKFSRAVQVLSGV